MPVHPKVKGATLAAAVAGVIVWLLSRYAFHGTIPAGYVAEIDAAVPAVLTFIAGWITPAKKIPPAPSLVEQMSAPLVDAAPQTYAAAGQVRPAGDEKIVPPPARGA